MSEPNQPMTTEQLMSMLGNGGLPPQAAPQFQAPQGAPQYQQPIPQPVYPQAQLQYQPPQVTPPHNPTETYPQAPQYQQPPMQQLPQAPQFQQPMQAPPGYPPVPGMAAQFPPINPPGEYQPGFAQQPANAQALEAPATEPGKRKRRTKAELAAAGGTTQQVTLGGQAYEITILITPVG